MNKIFEIFDKYKENLIILIYLLTLYLSREICLLMFNSLESPDFEKYFEYIRYFYNASEETKLSQGSFYYALQSWALYFYTDLISEDNFIGLISKSVQNVNLVLFLISQIGFYNLLRYFKFNKNSILLTLSLLNFFPLTIALRITMKPEILVLSFLPWLILFIEIFLKTKKYIYLYISIPLLSIILLSKGSSLAIVGLFFLIVYINKIKLIEKKQFIVLSIFFIVISSLIYTEDSNINNNDLLKPSHEEKYDNIAPFSVIYKLEFKNLVNAPFKNNLSNSFLGITLLDTFGDYFDLYWNNDSSNFFKNRKQLIIYNSENIKILPTYDSQLKQITVYSSASDPNYANSGDYLRDTFSWILTLLFYLLLFKLFKKKSQYKKYLIAPFVGMLVLLFTSISGFPVNNYDPIVSDTYKAFYYSYMVVIAFMFIFSELFDRSFYKKLYFVPILLIYLFILGFPKVHSNEFDNKVVQMNTYSEFCEVNDFLLKTLDYPDTDCSEQINITNKSEVKTIVSYLKKPRLNIINLLNAFLTILMFGYYFYNRKKIFNE